MLKLFLFLSFTISVNSHHNFERNISSVAEGLSKIIIGLQPNSLIIVTANKSNKDIVDDFIQEIHKENFKTCIFSNLSSYFSFIENAIKGSVESTSLIFGPISLIDELHDRNLAHRLSLFMFYWGSDSAPNSDTLRLEEPLRAVLITRPRPRALRVYYNQALPFGKRDLRLVNWFDGERLGLYKHPLLPLPANVYRNFLGRIFHVPAIHAPPWFSVKYSNISISKENETSNTLINEFDGPDFQVIGGRDHQLLKLLAWKLNFQFQYIDPPERTQGQGSSDSPDNVSFTGGLGMIQSGQAQLLFGDITLNCERKKAVEFTFFTLADSVAFVTQYPPLLSEALTLIRPFHMNVWPFLILTVMFTGPTLYFIISLPFYWSDTKTSVPQERIFFYNEYLQEITGKNKRIKRSDFNLKERIIPKDLFLRSIWFSVSLFLKQSPKEIYSGLRPRILIIIFWLSATYVLADVYSAKLTSQFARPARESPINSLSKLEYAMKYNGYKLFVERESSSLAMLENSTVQLKRLHDLMIKQDKYLVDSIEGGIRMIVNNPSDVILGGRETLFFNMKKFGLENFQLSYKLYTKYSAVAVQIGCPFLEILNEVLIRLFESGILDKITNDEYDNMLAKRNLTQKSEHPLFLESGKKTRISLYETGPINLTMLQGSFIILALGYLIAGVVFIFEVKIWSYKNKTKLQGKLKHLKKKITQ